jgi:serine/threonine kinase 16
MVKAKSSISSSPYIRLPPPPHLKCAPLTLYQRGNLQDEINRHVQTGTHYSERHLLQLFKGTCEAVRAMHTYRAPAGGASALPAAAHQNDDENDTMIPHPEGDGEGGYSYDGTDAAASVPLVTKQRAAGGDVVFDGDEQLGSGNSSTTGDVVPYAHRDLKPG